MAGFRFVDLEWRTSKPGARYKRVETPVAVLRLLELEPGFVDEEWCSLGHHGIVIEGSFEIETRERVETLEKGDALALREGTAHRAKAGTDGVTLFLVEGF